MILGARVHSACLRRRALAGARLFHSRAGADLVVASGGRVWGGCTEADAIVMLLEAEGVPRERLARELLSMSTSENAHYTTALLRRRGIERATVVTCSWHLERALLNFRREGLEVGGEPVEDPGARMIHKMYRYCRERVAARLDR